MQEGLSPRGRQTTQRTAITSYDSPFNSLNIVLILVAACIPDFADYVIRACTRSPAIPHNVKQYLGVMLSYPMWKSTLWGFTFASVCRLANHRGKPVDTSAVFEFVVLAPFLQWLVFFFVGLIIPRIPGFPLPLLSVALGFWLFLIIVSANQVLNARIGPVGAIFTILLGGALPILRELSGPYAIIGNYFYTTIGVILGLLFLREE